MIIPYDTHAAPLLGCYFDPWGSTYYRLAVPLGTLGAPVAPFYEASEAQQDAAETVVISRFSAKPGSDLDALRRLIAAITGDGRRLVVDLDDDYQHMPDGPRRRQANLDALELCARAADALIVPNEVLARRLRDWNANIRVLPNYVRPDHWPTPAEADGPVTVVLAGSSSHAEDWRIVGPALRRLRYRHPAVRLRCVGYCPPYLADLADEVTPWARADAYPAMLAGAHIGLAPLPTTPFNEAKSPIKAYEYALAGLAVVASPCQYGPAMRAAGLGAYVVGDAGNWYPALERLVTNAPERRAAAAALRTHVAATYDARHHTATIQAAYAA